METAEIRRLNLSRLIKAEGLSVVAAKVGKPDRQLNDMVAGRKSFGEKVARAIEKAYAPSRAPGWLDPVRDKPRRSGRGRIARTA